MTTLFSDNQIANIFTANNQNDVVLSPLASGGFVAVWVSLDQNGSGAGVVAQIYSPLGQRIGGEILVETDTVGDQNDHAVTGLSGGGFAVTWRDARTNDIKVQLFAADGAPVGTETKVNTEEYSTQSEPAIVALSGGGFTVLWQSFNDETFTWDIRAQRFDASGAPVGTEYTANTITTNSETTPAAASLGTGFVAVWETNLNSGDIIGQRFAADGSKLGGEFTVNSTTTNSQSDPQIVTLTGGRFVVVWTDDNDGSSQGIEARIFNADGTPVGSEFRVNVTTLSTQYQPTVTATADGGFFVAWYSVYLGDDFPYEIIGRKFDANGVGDPEGEVQLSVTTSTEVHQPSLAGLPNGLIATAWDVTAEDGDGDGRAVELRLFAPTDSTLVLPAAPVVDGLTAALTLTEAALNAGPVRLDTAVAVSDADTASFDGGRLILQRITAQSDLTQYGQGFDDTLGIQNQGTGAGQIGVSGSTVTFGGIAIGTIQSNGTNGADLVVLLNAQATHAATEALIEALTYATASNDPDTEVQLALLLEDGAGGSATPKVITIAITPETEARQPLGDAPERVNTTTENQQTLPDVAGLTGGGWVTVWQSFVQDNDNSWGVYGQRYDATGAPVGPEFRVNTTSNGSQTEPSVAALTTGGFVVVWDDTAGNGSLRAQRYDAAGTAVGGEIDLPKTGSNSQEQPSVAATAGGGFIVAFRDRSDSTFDYEISVQRFDAAGNPVGSRIAVNTQSAGGQDEPEVTVLTGGRFVVTWTDQDAAGDGAGYAAKARVFNANGTPVGAEFTVNTHTPGFQYEPAIAALDGGGFVVAWQDDALDGSSSGIFAQRYDANGAKVGTQFLVNEYTLNQQIQPTVASLPGGGFMIGWHGYFDGGYGVVAQSYDAAGQRVDGSVVVGDGFFTFDDVKLARLANGDVIATFRESNDGSSSGIVQRVIGTATNYPDPADDPRIVGIDAEVTLSEAAVNAGPVVIDAAVSVADADSANFAGGRLEITRLASTSYEELFAAPDDASQDVLGLRNQGNGAGQVGVAGNTVSFGGTAIGTLAVGAAGLSVTFTAAATAEAVEAVIENLTYANPSDDPEAARQFRITLTDGDGGSAEPRIITVNVTPEQDGLEAATPDTRTNTFDRSSQVQPDTAALSDGGYVVVWQSYDQDAPFTYGIFGQRYAADGTPVGGEFQANTATTSGQTEPAVTGLSGGGFVVGWRTDTVGGTPADNYLRLQVFDTAGAKVGGEIQVEGAVTGFGTDLALAQMTGGGFVAVYRAYDSTTSFNYNINLQQFDASGARVGAEVNVSASTHSSDSEPSVAQLSNGQIIVVWHDGSGTGDGSSGAILAQRLDAAGAKIGGTVVVNTSTEGNQYQPVVAALTGGGYVVAWTNQTAVDGSSFGVFAQRFDAAGNKVGPEFLVNEVTTSAQYEPDIVALADGGFAIAYRDDSGADGSSTGVFIQQYAADGSRVDGALQINTETDSSQYAPSLARLTSGRIVATWETNDSRFEVQGIAHRQFGTAPVAGASAAPVIGDVNDPPAVTIATAATPRFIDNGVSVTDADSANFAGGSLTLSWLDHRADAFEQLAVATTARVSVAGVAVSVDGVQIGIIDAALNGTNGADLRIAFDADATPARVRALIEALTHANTGAPPVAGERALGITLTDGDGGISEARSITISLQTSVGAPPSVSLTGFVSDVAFPQPEVTFAENALQAAPQAIDAAVDFDYAGAAGLANGYLEIRYTAPQTYTREHGLLDTLSVANIGSGAGQISVSGSTVSYGGTAFATISATDTGTQGDALRIDFGAAVTAAAVDALIEALRYQNTADGISIDRDIQFRVVDGGGQNTGFRTITLVNLPDDDGGMKPQDGEFQVNSEAENQQTAPDVFRLADGGFVSIWQSFDQDAPFSQGVFGQRFDANGTPVGPEFRANTNGFDNQTEPAGTGLAGGGFVVVWTDGNKDGSSQGIFARIYGADGVPGPEFQANFQASSTQYQPTVTQLADGNILIAWSAFTSAGSGDGNGYGVTGRIFTAAGTPVTNDFVLNTFTSSTQDEPSVTALAGGGFVAVYQSTGIDGASAGIAGQVFTAAGVKVGTEFVVNTTTAASQSEPKVATLAGGDFVVVWSDSSGGDGSGFGVYQQRFTATGVKVGGEELVNAYANSSQYEPEVLALADGGWLVAFSDNSGVYGSGGDVLAQQFSASGARIDGIFRINEESQSTQESAALAQLADGRVIAVWQSQTSGSAGDGSSTGIFGRFLGVGTAPGGADPVVDGLPDAVTLAESAVNTGYVSLAIAGAVVTDADSTNFAGGRLEITLVDSYSVAEQYAPPDDETQDDLSFVSARVAIVGTDVRIDGVSIGTLAQDGQNGAPLSVTFGANATPARVETLLEALGYRNVSDDPVPARDLRVVLTDGDGGSAVPVIVTVNVTPEPDAPGPVEGDQIVNSTTENAQSLSAVAALTGGGHVVVWQSTSQDDPDLGGTGIYGQRYDASGQPIGPEFQVNLTFEGQQSRPAVVALQGGGFFVGWDGEGPGDNVGVFGRAFGADGQPQGGEILLNTVTANSATNLALAANGAGGRILAVWDNNAGDASGNGVKARLFDANGAAVSTEFLINTTTTSTQWQPEVSALADGSFVVVWDSYNQDATNTYGVYAQRIGADGVKLGSEIAINTSTEGNQYAGGVAGLSGGGFVVVWQDDNAIDGSGSGVYAQRFDAAGAKIGPEFLVNATITSSQFEPTVAATPDGGFVVAWQDNGGTDGFSTGIIAQHYAADGSRIDGEFVVNEGVYLSQTDAALAVKANGGIIATWTSSSGSTPSFGTVGDGSNTAVVQRLFGDSSDFERGGIPELDAINPTVTYLENAVNNAAQLVDADAAAVVTDPDASGWGGGFLRIERVETSTAYSDQVNAPDNLTQDILGLRQGNGISIAGTTVSVDGTAVGTIASGGLAGTPFVITLNANATTAAVERLVENLTYRNASDDPEAVRSLRLQVGDGSGKASDPVIVTVNITPEVDGVSKIFGERQANTFETSTQDAPSVAAIDGGFVMVWQSFGQDSPSSWGIYGQRFDLDGNKVGGEFAVNPASTDSELDPHVTGLPGGGFAVVYNSESSDTVSLQRFNADGTPNGAAQVVHSYTSSTQYLPDITTLSDGRILVTWTSFGNSIPGDTDYGVYATVIDPVTGAKVATDFRVNVDTASSQDYPSVTATANGGFFIGWQSATSGLVAGDGNSTGSFGRIYTQASGVYTGGAELQLNTFTEGAQDQPDVTALAGGNLVAVWTSAGQDGSADGVYAQILSPAGVPIGPEFRVNENRSSSQYEPQVTALEGGGFVVVYSDNSGRDGSGIGVFAQQFDAAGARIDGPLQVNTEFSSTQNEPTVAALPGGGFVVGWTSQTSATAGDGSSTGIFYQIFGNAPPVVQDVVASATEDTVYTFDAAFFAAGYTDDDGQPLAAIQIGTLPLSGTLSKNGVPVTAGVQLTVAELDAGALTYTPAANFNGPDTFGWRGSDGLAFSPVQAQTLVNVAAVNDPVTVEAGGNATIGEGSSLNRQITLTDPDADIYTITIDWGEGNAPQVINTASKTPSIGNFYEAQGSYTVTVLVNDNAGSTSTDSFTVTVENAPPDARNDFYSTGEDAVLTDNLFESNGGGPDTDPGGDSFTITAINGAAYTPGTPLVLPSGATITLGADGAVAYDPRTSASLQALAGGQTGSDSFTYTITDAQGASDTATVSVSVQGADDNVDARDDAFTVNENSALTGDVFADNGNGPDADPEGDAITVVSVNGNAALVGAPVVLAGGGVLTIGADGALSFNAAGQYEELGVGESQIVTFTYVAEEAGSNLTASATGTITITGVNDQPVANDDGIGTLQGQPTAEFSVLGNDFDVDGDLLTVTAFTQGSNGSVTSGSNGAFVYTPNAGFSGVDSFTYTVSDGQGGSDTATVTVNVAPPSNTPPTGVADSYALTEDTPLSVAGPGVLANDTDAEGNALTAELFSNAVKGSVTLNADGSFTYSPFANQNGPDSFAYRAFDGTSYSAVTVVSLNIGAVNDAPVAVDDTITVGEDGAVAIPVLANDFDVDSDPVGILSVTDAANGAVTFAAGVVNYVPYANYFGTDSFTYTVSDGQGGSDIATVTVTVTGENDAPVAVDDTVTLAEDGSAVVTVLANDSDVDGNPLTVSAVTQGANGTVVLNANGTVGYTPNANFNGTDSFSYTVSDGQGGSDTATVSVTVTPVNDAPVAVDDTVTLAEDGSAVVTVLANDSDVDGNPLTVSAVTQGANGTVVLNANGTVGYTPNANFNGTDSFTYTVSDGQGGSDTATVSVTVTPVNDAPVAVDDTVTLAEDGSAVVTVLANDSDVDGNPLTVSAVTQGANGTVVLNANGTVGYTPNANFNGSDSFTYTVSDGQGGTDTATVLVLVDPVNDAPVAVDDAFSTAFNTAVTIPPPGVLANDTDVDSASLTATVASQPGNGTVTVNANGSFTYTPNAGYSGSDSFTYTVSDGAGGSDTGTVAITVGTNANPVAANDNATVAEDGAVDITVLANDSDADGNALAVASFGQGANGTVAANTDGSLRYTPNANFNGMDAFTYTVADGQGGSASATVNVTVTPVNDNPVAADDSFATAFATPLLLTAAQLVVNDSDVDDDALTVDEVGIATGGNVTLEDGEITFTPDAGFSGNASFTYTVSDGEGGTDTATVTIAVAGPGNTAPVAVDDSYTARPGQTLTVAAAGLLANDTDADGDPLSVVSFGSPANGSLEVFTDGSFTYTANAGFTGTETILYTISDGLGGTDTGTLSIDVVNQNPVAVDDTATTTEGVAVTIDALANDSDGDGDPLTITGVTDVTGGTVSIVNDEFVFTPTAGFSGAGGFSYSVADGFGGTDSAQVSVTVTPDDPDPVLLFGTNGNDYLIGTAADEIIDSLAGRIDVVKGGGGADTFVFSSTANGVRETRTIIDFAADDLIDLGTASVTSSRQLGADLYLFLDQDRDIVILKGVSGYETDYFV